MDRKHNKTIVPTAKTLRKNMTNQVNEHFREVCEYIDDIVKQSLSQFR